MVSTSRNNVKPQAYRRFCKTDQQSGKRGEEQMKLTYCALFPMSGEKHRQHWFESTRRHPVITARFVSPPRLIAMAHIPSLVAERTWRRMG